MDKEKRMGFCPSARMTGSTQIKRWIITRYVVEKFEIYAKTRKEAMENVDDPYSIMVTKETCIQGD